MTLPERAQPFAMLLAGFVLWSVVFVALYGMQATGCRIGWQSIEIAGPVTLQRAVLVLMLLGALVLHAWLYVLLRRTQETSKPEAFDFSRRVGALLALAALGAALFCFSGVFWLSVC